MRQFLNVLTRIYSILFQWEVPYTFYTIMSYFIHLPIIVVIENFGVWTQRDGLKLFFKNIPINKRRINFQKREIIVGVVLKDAKNLQIKNYDDIS